MTPTLPKPCPPPYLTTITPYHAPYHGPSTMASLSWHPYHAPYHGPSTMAPYHGLPIIAPLPCPPLPLPPTSPLYNAPYHAPYHGAPTMAPYHGTISWHHTIPHTMPPLTMEVMPRAGRCTVKRTNTLPLPYSNNNTRLTHLSGQ